jgi:hypothetical protein
MNPQNTNPARQPTLEMAGWLAWRANYSEIIFAEPPYLVLQMTPVFPGCHPALAERGVVWDVFSLIESVKRPGAHQLLTGDCGYAPDVYIEESVLVSHPDGHTVVWELDSKGLRPALDVAVDDEDGFVRWTFAREDYEHDVRALLREVQARIAKPVAVNELTDTYGLDHLHRNYADLKTLRVEDFEPDTRGMAEERLLEIDPDAPWPREPVWPAGTLLDFGFFKEAHGHNMMMVNGQVQKACWPGHYFTRWEALSAFKAWIATTERGLTLPAAMMALGDKVAHFNTYFLRQEEDRHVCHAAGHRLAQVLQQGYEEGHTAPEVTVCYRECMLTVQS